MSNLEPLPLFNGGPLDRILRKVGLDGVQNRQLLGKIVLGIFITWFPLLIFSRGDRSFLADFVAYARFFIALPVLVIAEAFVQPRTNDLLPVLRRRGVLGKDHAESVNRACRVMRVLRDSSLAEVVILFLAIGLVLSKTLLTPPSSFRTWKVPGEMAHFWFLWVSVVFYQFLVFRWVWRYLNWCIFLFRLGTMKLRLNGQHPDRVGGLYFVTVCHVRFALVVSAISSVASANVASLVMHGGRALGSFEALLVAYLLIVVGLFIVPLLIFTPKLIKTKRESIARYGDFAHWYVDLFADRWFVHGAQRDTRDPLGTPDIQSLNDLTGGYRHVAEMRPFLLNLRQVLGVVVFAVVPLLPLVLFEIPFIELVKKIAVTLV